MDINYQFVPEHVLKEQFDRQVILSHACKLLEAVGQPTLLVGIDNMGVPYVYSMSGRMADALDFCYPAE